MGPYLSQKGISPKVDVIARREVELACNDGTVMHVNHYTTETPQAKQSDRDTNHSWISWNNPKEHEKEIERARDKW